MVKQLSQRQLMFGESIRRTIAELLTSRIDSVRGLHCSIQKVVMSPDLRHAKIYVDAIDVNNIAKAVENLNLDKDKIRHLIATSVVAKFLPDLVFYPLENELNNAWSGAEAINIISEKDIA